MARKFKDNFTDNSFIIVEEDSTPKKQKIISIHGYDSDNESDFWICLNESTAIKFAKTIRTEINKIKNSDFETRLQ